jgi:hypothetical protein
LDTVVTGYVAAFNARFWLADSLLQQACATGADSLARELLPKLIVRTRNSPTHDLNNHAAS